MHSATMPSPSTESRLNQYSGQYLRVTGSTEIKPGDDIVETVLVDPSGKSNGQDPIKSISASTRKMAGVSWST